MSGICWRPGLRNRSNSRSYLIGSMSTMRRQYATHEPAALPRPGPTRMPLRLRVAHEVPHDEEVRREAHRLDDVELVLDALDHVQRRVVAVALLRALHRELAQVGVLVVALRHRERRQDRLAELDLDVGALGDQQRVVARVGQLAEQRAHLGRRLDVEVVAVELEAVGVALERAGLHAQQRVVRFGVVACACSGCRWSRAAAPAACARCRAAAADATSSSMPWSCSSMKKWSRPKMSWKRPAALSAASCVAREDAAATRAHRGSRSSR